MQGPLSQEEAEGWKEQIESLRTVTQGCGPSSTSEEFQGSSVGLWEVSGDGMGWRLQYRDTNERNLATLGLS